jgi:DNA-binding transcriptional LysR family regulator
MPWPTIQAESQNSISWKNAMDRIEELAIFVAIVDTGSLAGAAKRLKRSPPAVTRALAAVERRVGTRLVERTTRRLHPTEAGRRFAERARALLNDYSGALSEISSEQGAPLRGLLRITAPTVFGRRHVAPLVTSFLDAHSAVRIELVLGERNLDLIDEGLDLAIRISQLADSRLVARRVGEIRRTLVASPTYLRNRPELRSPRDLARHDIVFYSGFGAPTEWRFQARGRRQSIRLTPRIMVTDVDAVIAMVRAGRGVGRVFSYQVATEIASGKLVRLLPTFEPPAVPVQVVVPSARHMAPAVRAFMDHVVKSLRTLPAIH